MRNVFRALSGFIFCVFFEMFKLCYLFHHFGPHVLQTTLCVTFFARRRSVPSSILGGLLAPSAARTGRDIRDGTAPPGITSPSVPEAPQVNHKTPLRALLESARELLRALESLRELPRMHQREHFHNHTSGPMLVFINFLKSFARGAGRNDAAALHDYNLNDACATSNRQLHIRR